MKRQSMLVLAMILGITFEANADLVTYEFSGTGIRMYELDGQSGTLATVPDSSLFGFNLSNDATFNGLFTYDTLAIESSVTQNDSYNNHAIYVSALPQFDVDVDGRSYSFQSSGLVQIWNNYATGLADRFSTHASESLNSDLFIFSRLYMHDGTGQSFAGLSIPDNLDQISSAGPNEFNFSWLDRNNGNQLLFYGDITHLVPVPTPTALLLGVIGLGMAGGKLHRRRTA